MLHVPHIAKNLLSISRFVSDNNAIAEFVGHSCVIKDKVSKRMLPKGTLKDGLYELHLSGGLSNSIASNFNSANKHNAAIVSCSQFSACKHIVYGLASPLYDRQTLPCNVANNIHTHFAINCQVASLWHSKFGHPSNLILQQILKQMHVPSSINALSPYESCRYGKMHQLPFSRSSIKTKSPHELVYTDIWGRSPISFLDGHKYYIVFIDCHTRFSWLYPLPIRLKLRPSLHFKNKLSYNSTQKIRMLQTDMGLEFKAFGSYLKSVGITHRFSCAYTHQQNGVIERKHHIVETGLTLLTHASMPSQF
ncbi:hypothetical protein ACOSQ3_024264 [Xanthoceras sorbifolium]